MLQGFIEGGAGGHLPPLESYVPPLGFCPPLDFALHMPTLHGTPPKMLNRPLCPLLQKLLDETLMHELIPPCDTRRREKVGALYGAVSGLLAVISRAYPRFLSPAPRNIIIYIRIVHCVCVCVYTLNPIFEGLLFS